MSSEGDEFYEDIKRKHLEMDTGEEKDWRNPHIENAFGNGNRKNEEENFDKDEAKMDLSNRCTPSYLRLPDNHPQPRTSWRTELGDSVLNDKFVSVASGSEDCNYKFMTKNRYEEALSSCDDDRYGLDMSINVASSTIKKVEKLVDMIERGSIELKANFQIKEHIPGQCLRLIEGIYGEYGLEVVNMLRKKPTLAALIVILSRLNQKHQEWSNCLANFNKVWAHVHAKYHTKSLDYCGNDFKKQDQMNLKKEALLAEVRDINKKRQENDERFVDSIYGSWQHVIPDMEWEYPDEEVHEDIYKIIEFSSGEFSKFKEQGKDIMNIWITFFEPFLNISRLQVPKVIEEKNLSSPENSGERKNLSSPDIGIHSTEIQLSYIHPTVQAGLQHEETRSCKQKSASGNSIDSKMHDRDLSFYQGSLAHENSSRDKLSGVSGFGKANLAPLHRQSSSTTYGRIVDPDFEENGTRAGPYYQALDPSYELEEGEIPPEGYEQKSSMDYEVGIVAKPEGEIGETANAHNINKEGTSLSLLHPNLDDVKPLRKRAPKISDYEKHCDSRIFFCNDSFYVLIKLHQILYQRLLWAKTKSFAAQETPKTPEDLNSTDRYAKFKSTLHNLLGGSMDNLEYEDKCFSILGTQSYVLFTMDLLIHAIVKQLQAIASNETDCKFLQLYEYENSRKIGTVNELVYHKNTLEIQDGSKFRFECASVKPTKLVIHLIKDFSEHKVIYALNPEPEANISGNSLSSLQDAKKGNSVFLRRNKRKLCYGDDDDELNYSCKGYMVNGSEYFFSNSPEVCYVMGTENFFYRARKKKCSNSENKTEQ